MEPGNSNQQLNPPKFPMILVVISILVTAIIVGLITYLVVVKSFDREKRNLEQQITDLQNQINQLKKQTEISDTALPPQKIYFGKGWEGTYYLVDVLTGETKEFIPSGYEIVGQHSYQVYPEFLILKKDNQLFSYSLVNKTLNKIEVRTLKNSEMVGLSASISDNSKFYLVINDTKEVPYSMIGYEVIGSKKYFFDANNNQIQNADDIELPGVSDFSGCYEYDSKHSRFFVWPCGEGIGTSIPLLRYDLTNKTQKEIVTFQDFELSEDDIGLVAVEYNSGFFLTIPKSKNKFSKIIIIDPTKDEIIKETYIIPERVKSELNKTYPYSALLIKQKNIIAIGGDDFILLLRFNNNKEITGSIYLSDPEIYANFSFTDGEKIYYQSKNAIKVINLDSQQIEKTILSETNEEITLFSLPNN